VLFSLAHWLIGFPSALWLSYRVTSGVAAFQGLHPALLGGIYLYLFLLAVLLFQMVIRGFRWLFPIIELVGARSKIVRGILGTILTALLLSLLYDVLKSSFRF
jgi:hypothetical protein